MAHPAQDRAAPLRPVLLAILLVTALGPLADAAGDPHARPAPLATASPPVALAVAHNGMMLAATTDSGSNLPGGDPAARTWYLWDRDGNLVNAGNTDLPTCASRVGDTCKTPATLAALSGDGSRWAIAGKPAAAPADTVRGILVLGTTSAGVRQRVTFNNPLAAVALDVAGTHLATTESVPAPLGGVVTGQVQLWSWNGAGPPTALRSNPYSTAAALAQASFASDGSSYLVAAGKVYRFTLSESEPQVRIPSAGTPLAVAVAPGAPSFGLIGYDDGTLETVADGRMENPLLIRKPGSAAVHAVAAQQAGTSTYLAAGDDSGKLHLFQATKPPVGNLTASFVASYTAAPDAIRELAWSADGRLLAVRSATTVALYATPPAGTSTGPASSTARLLWSDALTTPVATGLDWDGELVAAAAADGVRVWDARHRLVMADQDAAGMPGGNVSVAIPVRNDGNRPVRLTFDKAGPAGWNTTLAPAGLQLFPGESGTATLLIHVPPGQAPGPVTFEFGATDAAGNTTVSRIHLEVATVTHLKLEAQGAVSAAINPGATVQFTAQLSNLGNAEATIAPKAQVDKPGWSIAVTPAQVTLPPGGKAPVRVTLSADGRAAEGDRARATLTAADATLDLYGTVGARFGLSLSAPASLLLAAGNSSEVVATLRNTGNTVDSYSVATAGLSAGWVAIVDQAGSSAQTSLIDPGATVDIHVSLRSPALAATGSRATLVLEARSLGDASQHAQQRVEIQVAAPNGSVSPTKGSPGLAGPAAPAVLLLLAFAIRSRSRR